MEKRLGETPSRAKDLLPIDQIEVSGHALMQFQIRAGLSLLEASSQIRERLGESILITTHSSVSLEKREVEGKRKGIFFQDPNDENIVYVVSRKKREGSYVLISAIKPLRKK